jgi:predicted  nucleic acid-binding Zn-ribbon protein
MKSFYTRTFVIYGALLFLACSCGSKPKVVTPPVTPPVNVESVDKKVLEAKDFAAKARERLFAAEIELSKAREDADAAELLVAEMRKANSGFADHVEELRVKYVGHINNLTKQIDETGVILDGQLKALREAGEEINKARQASANSEAEKAVLRNGNKTLAENLSESEKRADKLQSWKDKNSWYKKFFWWTVIGAVLFSGVYVYFTGATGGLAKLIRR